MLGSVAVGTVTITDLAPGADVAATMTCFRAMGADIAALGATSVRIAGRGWAGLAPAGAALDAGNSGTTMRLVAGLVAGRPFRTTLTGDDSLRRRPMARIIRPLEAMGARVQSIDGHAPLTIDGGRLTGIRWRPPVPSAQVKSALMLAGLSATGETIIEEPQPTRDHSERAFPVFGLEVHVEDEVIRVPGGQEARAPAAPLAVPGDPSSAAVWAAAAAALPGSAVQIDDVLLNPRRLGFIRALRAMGADITVAVTREAAGESTGTIRVRHGGHGACTIAGPDVPDLIDELPVLAARAALGGSLEVSGAAELRVKESDRISALVRGLRARGVSADERPDGFVIDGTRRPAGGAADAAGDHRLVMAFALVGLGAGGPTTVRGADAVAVSYPDFARDLAALAT
jgi:3-phosphoshikimate 1-carboxyvinyltransferase